VSSARAPTQHLGELLQEFVNRVSHLQGNTLRVLTEESVTLQQVLLLRRLRQLGESSPSELAAVMRMSLPAVSQMIDRLFFLGLVTRVEASDDRRRKRLAVAARGDALLMRIRKARATEYAAGTAGISAALRAELSTVLEKVLRELPKEADAIAPAVPGARSRRASS
jgi:DNA-binding MarR family transcriptional regulator